MSGVDAFWNPDGTSLQLVQTAAPTSPQLGQQWFDPDTMRASWWDGTTWRTGGIACRARRTADQSITNAANNPIEFTAADDFDPLNWHDPAGPNPSRITPTLPGFYLAGSSVRWAGNVTGARVHRVLMNTTVILCTTTTGVVSSGTTEQNVVGVGQLNGTTDYLEAVVFQTSGAALSINDAVAGALNFWVVYLGNVFA